MQCIYQILHFLKKEEFCLGHLTGNVFLDNSVCLNIMFIRAQEYQENF